MKTNDLKNGGYVYCPDYNRYLLNRNELIQMCRVYDCTNGVDCVDHLGKEIVVCKDTKCNNCFVKCEFNYCNICRQKNHRSKNRLRDIVKIFKEELGGKCVDCGFSDLFYLEFDHIDPSKKTVQITRSKPSDWERDKDNLELRCGRCHRIKSNYERTEKFAKNQIDFTRQDKCRINKKEFVKWIKKSIGECQICKWTLDDKDLMCSALDFDHIVNDKYKQISNLYTYKREKIKEEIAKTRLICRHCHELHTCIQRGGKKLDIYYNSSKKEKLIEMVVDENSKLECNKQILEILQKL